MTLPVISIDGSRVRELPVFVYIMHEDRHIGVPTRYYLDTCLEGYRTFGFDEGHLSDALNLSLEEVNYAG